MRASNAVIIRNSGLFVVQRGRRYGRVDLGKKFLFVGFPEEQREKRPNLIEGRLREVTSGKALQPVYTSPIRIDLLLT